MTGKGAGKPTLSSVIVFTRLSIDAIVADRHGIYNIDYPPSQYEAHLEDARQVFSEQASEMLGKKNIVLDSLFWAKKGRDENAGGRWILVFLKAERDILWKRICERRQKGVNADSAREMD